MDVHELGRASCGRDGEDGSKLVAAEPDAAAFGRWAQRMSEGKFEEALARG